MIFFFFLRFVLPRRFRGRRFPSAVKVRQLLPFGPALGTAGGGGREFPGDRRQRSRSDLGGAAEETRAPGESTFTDVTPIRTINRAPCSLERSNESVSTPPPRLPYFLTRTLVSHVYLPVLYSYYPRVIIVIVATRRTNLSGTVINIINIRYRVRTLKCRIVAFINQIRVDNNIRSYMKNISCRSDFTRFSYSKDTRISEEKKTPAVGIEYRHVRFLTWR